MKSLITLAASPVTYVIGFSVGGAACVVSGVAVMAGAGSALITAGAFLIAGAAFIMRGMRADG